MNHWIKLLTALVASAVIASTAAALALAGGAATGGAKVVIARSPLGRILVDSKGITLYDFVKDKGTTSKCNGACTKEWHPVTTTGTPQGGSGLTASKFGTTMPYSPRCRGPTVLNSRSMITGSACSRA